MQFAKMAELSSKAMLSWEEHNSSSDVLVARTKHSFQSEWLLLVFWVSVLKTHSNEQKEYT